MQQDDALEYRNCCRKRMQTAPAILTKDGCVRLVMAVGTLTDLLVSPSKTGALAFDVGAYFSLPPPIPLTHTGT